MAIWIGEEFADVSEEKVINTVVEYPCHLIIQTVKIFKKNMNRQRRTVEHHEYSSGSVTSVPPPPPRLPNTHTHTHKHCSDAYGMYIYHVSGT